MGNRERVTCLRSGMANGSAVIALPVIAVSVSASSVLAPFLIAVLLFFLIAAPLRAQSVRGRIVEDDGGRPVIEALVQLLGPRDEVLASGTSSLRGEYLLQAPLDGPYRVRVLRIGFRPWVSEPVALSETAVQTRELRVDAGVVMLAELTVRARSSCRRSPAEDSDMEAVWQQARTVLGLIDAGAGGDLEFLATNSERTLDQYERLVQESKLPSFGRGSWPIVSQSPDSLAQFGFIQVHDTLAGPIYYGPDVGVFFSDGFLTSHCFRLLPPPKGESELIGLGFEPVSGRKLPDIEGALWVHRTTGLSRLEYRYTRMPGWMAQEKAGGLLRFDRLASGRPILTTWSIQAPIPRIERSRVVLHGFRQTLGEVQEVRNADSVVWRRPAS